MLIETKAKVGVFSIALQAYLPQFPELVPEFEEQYAAFKKTLSSLSTAAWSLRKNRHRLQAMRSAQQM